RPALLQAGGILVVTAAAVAAVAVYNMATIALLCLATAIASGLAKLAVDAVIQERVPERVRATAFAHAETLLMVAWVAGGALGLIPFEGRIGLGVLAAFVTLGLVRAVLVTGRLRTERLNGAPPTDDSEQTFDLASGTAAPLGAESAETPQPTKIRPGTQT